MPFNSTLPVSAYDYRELARKKLPRKFFDYLDGGSYNEMIICENKVAYQPIHLHKRIFQDTPYSDTTTEIFDQKITQPVILAPVGYAGIYARRGEMPAACAAKKAGVPFCLVHGRMLWLRKVSKALLRY